MKKLVLTRDKDENIFKKDLFDMDTPYEPGSYFYQRFDSFTCFVHIFVFEAFNADWSTMQTGVRWNPNEVTFEKHKVQNWRGQYVQEVRFEKL